MKIQCDVCNKEEASVFCTADEAALCKGCDHRVHHANKLASKHHRFPLLNPTIRDAPRCDVCQERRAFLFCREDRAILCRECDLPIHTANEHTQKHNRFLLTGVKLASAASLCNSRDEVEPKAINNPRTVTVPSLPHSVTSNQSKGGGYAAQPVTSGGGSTSSIAEYLIETLPGWHVEDFLDSSSAPQNGFCKNDDLSPFLDADIETDLGKFPCDDLGIWVPQIPSPASQPLPQISGFSKEVKDMHKSSSNIKVNKRWTDHGFTVPQISPPSNKRSRSFW